MFSFQHINPFQFFAEKMANFYLEGKSAWLRHVTEESYWNIKTMCCSTDTLSIKALCVSLSLIFKPFLLALLVLEFFLNISYHSVDFTFCNFRWTSCLQLFLGDLVMRDDRPNAINTSQTGALSRADLSSHLLVYESNYVFRLWSLNYHWLCNVPCSVNHNFVVCWNGYLIYFLLVHGKLYTK